MISDTAMYQEKRMKTIIRKHPFEQGREIWQPEATAPAVHLHS